MKTDMTLSSLHPDVEKMKPGVSGRSFTWFLFELLTMYSSPKGLEMHTQTWLIRS